MGENKNWLWWWRPIFVILVPFILLPIPLIMPNHYPNTDPKSFWCLYVVCWMIFYWVAEVVPLPVTAFMPLILFPYFGIEKGKTLAPYYFQDSNFVLTGSFLMAGAIEETNLHKRLALRTLLLMGSDPRWLMLGFHLTGGFLSMWIANAAVVAMLLPPAFAIINELTVFGYMERNNIGGNGTNGGQKRGGKSNKVANWEMTTIDRNKRRAQNVNESFDDDGSGGHSRNVTEADSRKFDAMIEKIKNLPADQIATVATSKEMHIYRIILLSICFSCNIGGTGTLTGSPPTIVLQGLIGKQFPGSQEITYAKWMGFAVPPVAVALILAYLILLAVMEVMSHSQLQKFRRANLNGILRRQYRELGPMRFEELVALVGFICLFLMWFFRDPGFPGFDGWVSIFTVPKDISIGGVTMTAAFFLFIMPRQLPWNPSKPQSSLLSWQLAQKKIPWGILMLVGGGYAMAQGIEKSGLSTWIGSELIKLNNISPFALMLIGVVIAGVLTEFTSNVVVVEVLVPILGTLATQLCINPLYLILPAVLKSSFAFMLPVATPPNALIFNYGMVKVYHMMIIGFLLNVMVFGVIVLFIQTYGTWFYSLDTYPKWAPACNITSTPTTPFTSAIPT